MRWWRVVAVALVPVLLCTVGVLLYLKERDARQLGREVGDRSAADRVEIQVTVQQVDAADQRAVLRVLAVPRGTFAADEGATVPSHDIEVQTSSLTQTDLRYPAGETISAHDVPVSLADGTISDYPFDSYVTDIGFAAVVNGQRVPVVLSVGDVDPFFVFTSQAAHGDRNVAVLREKITRSRGTLILGWFMMAAMWALALAVAAGAWIIGSQRRGLVWPALGWMAATLFALVGLRNAAPGAPPIGSLLDYAAFFWAELLIALSLVHVAVQGSGWSGCRKLATRCCKVKAELRKVMAEPCGTA
jgi:hypothetical protein